MINSWGQSKRLEKLKKDNYFLILAMDHALTSGSIKGIQSVNDLNKWILFAENNDIPAVVLNYHYIKNLNTFNKTNIVVQTMGQTKYKKEINKVQLAEINDVTSVDGSAISVQINFGVDNLDIAIKDISKIVSKAHKKDYPVLFMIGDSDWKDSDSFEYAIRVCSELGADLIKVNLPSDDNISQEISYFDENEPILLLAGGENMDGFNTKIERAKKIGFQGVCLGRNIFQNKDPKKVLNIIEKNFSKKSIL